MEQRTKIITLASFVDDDKIEGFSDYIKKRFNIPKEKLFMYSSVTKRRTSKRRSRS